MRIVHFTQAVEGRRPLARDEAERRSALRALTLVGGHRLLLFSLVDDHLHAVLADARPERVGYLVRDLRRSLRVMRPDLSFEPAHVKEVRSRAHLTGLLDYLLRQPEKHGLAGAHPALFSGSCFQDLVGVRILAGFEPSRICAELPRLTQRDLYGRVGLPAERIHPATNEQLRRVGAARLVELAAATLGVGPRLTGPDPVVRSARALAVRLAVSVLGFSTREVGSYVGVDLRTVQRLAQAGRDKQLDPRAETALRRRLTLEERVVARIRAS